MLWEVFDSYGPCDWSATVKKSSVGTLRTLFFFLPTYGKSPNSCFYYCFLRIGVAFTGTNGDIMEIKTFGKSEKYVKSPNSKQFERVCDSEVNILLPLLRYKLLHVLEFDANRRRMSVILQKPSGNDALIHPLLPINDMIFTQLPWTYVIYWDSDDLCLPRQLHMLSSGTGNTEILLTCTLQPSSPMYLWQRM